MASNFLILLDPGRLAGFGKRLPKNQWQQEENDKYEEQDFRNGNGSCSDAAKAKDGCDDRDYQEGDCPT